MLAGPLFSSLNWIQSTLSRRERLRADLGGAVFVIGYWRSGTTLLHNYLCCDRRFGYPTTYACMNAQHFVLTQSQALKQRSRSVKRPMDDVRVSLESPQEDEFGLLALGARSPYEGLMVPSRLGEALSLADVQQLSDGDKRRWQQIFLYFLRCVSLSAQGRPLILKSPTHGYRISTLRALMPDARFILIVRSPEMVFESAVRMWQSLCALYALEALPEEDEFRRVVLADRPRFEAKLAAGLQGVPEDRMAMVRYEELTRNPVPIIGQLYEQLQLGDFSTIEPALSAEARRNASYQARQAPPPDPWMQPLRQHWRAIFERYQYSA